MSSSNFEMGCSVDRRLDTSEGNSSTQSSGSESNKCELERWLS